MFKKEIPFCSYKNPQPIVNGVIEGLVLDIKRFPGHSYCNVITHSEFTREECLEIIEQILSNQEKAEKWDKQKYIYEQNYEKALRDFNNLTEEEYQKYSSIAVCLTWLANEEESKNKAIVECAKICLKEARLDQSHYSKEEEGYKAYSFLIKNLQKILQGEEKK